MLEASPPLPSRLHPPVFQCRLPAASCQAVQDRRAMNITASLGVAFREFSLPALQLCSLPKRGEYCSGRCERRALVGQILLASFRQTVVFCFVSSNGPSADAAGHETWSAETKKPCQTKESRSGLVWLRITRLQTVRPGESSSAERRSPGLPVRARPAPACLVRGLRRHLLR